MGEKENNFFIEPDDPPSKRAILNAAFKLFVRDGFDSTNIREIGKEAGYSNPALFKFFDSKDALGLYLFERCYLNYADIFGSAIQPQRSFEKNLDETLDRFCEVLNKNPGSFLFFQDHLRHFWPRVSPQVRKKSILVQIQRLIEQGVTEKCISDVASTKMLVAAFVGFVTQFARMYYFGEFKGGVDAWKSQIKAVSRKMLAA